MQSQEPRYLWWQMGVIDQIYPRSSQESDADVEAAPRIPTARLEPHKHERQSHQE